MQHPVVNVKLDDNAYMPERAHDTDAGADIRTPHAFAIRPHESVIVPTGVHVELPEGTVGMLKSKSGLNVNRNITSEGVIDEGFTGEIIVKLYNHGPFTEEFAIGDKITQLVIMPVLYPTYQQADVITGGERGDNGYGSTGR